MPREEIEHWPDLLQDLPEGNESPEPDSVEDETTSYYFESFLDELTFNFSLSE